MTDRISVKVMNVICDVDGNPVNAKTAAKTVTSAFFSTTVTLVIGGFSISAAFSKFKYELEIANFIQAKLGKRPRLFLLAFMSLGWFLSMVRLVPFVFR